MKKSLRLSKNELLTVVFRRGTARFTWQKFTLLQVGGALLSGLIYLSWLVIGERSAFISPPLPISTQISPVDGMVLVYVPVGTFQMGSTKGLKNQRPIHTVTLDAFWIDRTEVTNAMYAHCIEEGYCRRPYCDDYSASDFADHPVVCIDWYQAVSYCTWAGRKLPTEAQWEYAARGTDGRTYPWGDGIDCSLANYDGCEHNVARVGSYPDGASPFGSWDMAGNVWEWVHDWHGKDYYSVSIAINPEGPEAGDERVLRSGSSVTSIYGVRTSYRGWLTPDFWGRFHGFRCAISP